MEILLCVPLCFLCGSRCNFFAAQRSTEDPQRSTEGAFFVACKDGMVRNSRVAQLTPVWVAQVGAVYPVMVGSLWTGFFQI